MIDVWYKFADGTLLLGVENRRRYPTHTLPPISSPGNLFSPGREGRLWVPPSWRTGLAGGAVSSDKAPLVGVKDFLVSTFFS